MPSDHPPTTGVSTTSVERLKDGKQEIWEPDGKGWREIQTRSVENDIRKLGLIANA